MKVVVESVNNGFIISSIQDYGEGEVEIKTVTEGHDNNATLNCSDPIAIRRMLYEVLEQLGEYQSKHNKCKVAIVFEQDGEYYDDWRDLK